VFLYIIRDQSHRYKLGIAGNPTKRLAQLQTGCASRLQLVHQIEINPGIPALGFEKRVHSWFLGQRCVGEWFKLSEAEVDWLKTIQTAAQMY